jgi:hypothetical protein
VKWPDHVQAKGKQLADPLPPLLASEIERLLVEALLADLKANPPQMDETPRGTAREERATKHASDASSAASQPRRIRSNGG